MEIRIEDRCMRDLGSGREDAEHDDALYAEIRAELLAQGITDYPVRCSACQGTGKVGEQTCEECGGDGEYRVKV